MSGVSTAQYTVLLKLLVVFVGLMATSASLELTLSSEIVVTGDDVIICCRVPDFRTGWLIFWWKKQETDAVQIGSNDFVNNVVKETGRYSIDIEEEHDDVIFILTIADARPEDSGQVGCSLAQKEGSDIYRSLTVIAPVGSVRLLAKPWNESSDESLREYMQGEVVDFVEGDSYFFRCIVHGSSPAPDVVFYRGTEDITHLFERDDQHNIEGDIPGMKRIIHTVTLSSSEAVVPSWMYNGVAMRCVGSVSFTSPVSAYVTPQIKFRPQVSCPSAQLSPASVEGLRLTCTVRANPRATDVVWSWQKTDGTVMTLAVGETAGSYSAIVKDGDASDEKLVSLVIEKVFPQMFRSYTLEARSSNGHGKGFISLERKITEETVGGAASLPVTTLLCLLFALASSLCAL